MSMGPIPSTSIQRWAVFHGITDYDEFDVFNIHIRALERKLFEIEKKRETENK